MDIDLVYLWVDDNDPKWLEEKNKYLNKEYNSDAINNCRFFNNDELKYSLRSVEKYAPWINKIFIVTYNQEPKWLNINNPKIKIVDHSEIIPKENIPLFNSCAIETRIPYIEGLSEYFLYANDDMFFGDYVDRNFFFDGENPICRVDKFFNPYRAYKGLYGSTILNAYNYVKSRFKVNFYAFFPHHNIDAYRKSLFLECIKEYQEEFNETLNHRFREENDVQRMIVSFYMLAMGKAKIKKIRPRIIDLLTFKQCDSTLINVKSSNINKIRKCKTKLFCINDTKKTTDDDRRTIRVFLEEKFNEKSSFER